ESVCTLAHGTNYQSCFWREFRAPALLDPETAPPKLNCEQCPTFPSDPATAVPNAACFSPRTPVVHATAYSITEGGFTAGGDAVADGKLSSLVSSQGKET